MRKIKCFILITMMMLSGCSVFSESDSENIPGVVIENDEVYSITFELPEGESIEEVLGSEVGSEHQMAITFGNDTSISYWYVVENGGLLSRYGNYYRYGPTAEIVDATGVSSPPAGIILQNAPDQEDLFDPEDVDLLSEKYGISLNFDENSN